MHTPNVDIATAYFFFKYSFSPRRESRDDRGDLKVGSEASNFPKNVKTVEVSFSAFQVRYLLCAGTFRRGIINKKASFDVSEGGFTLGMYIRMKCNESGDGWQRGNISNFRSLLPGDNSTKNS